MIWRLEIIGLARRLMANHITIKIGFFRPVRLRFMSQKRKFEVDSSGVIDLDASPKEVRRQTGKFTGDSYFLNELDNQYPNLSKIHLSEVFDYQNLKSLFLSTYSLDMEYFLGLVPKKNMPITLVKHWSRQSGEKAGIFPVSPSVVVCHPKMDSYGSVHSKLWLLEFDNYLRVVVTSGNMTEPDWTMYIQTIWIQDFPRTTVKKSCEFLDVLCDFWKHATHGLPHEWLMNYDFSDAKVHLVPSIPGWHHDSYLNKYGMKRIHTLLQKYKFTKDPSVYYQCSSIGKMHKNWVPELCKQLGCREDKFSIIFPTKKTVLASRLGKEGAGMSFLEEDNYNSDSFPRKNMCDFGFLHEKSFLAHAKILAGFEVVNKELNGWIMIGSHNLSGAALGRMQKNGTQIQIYNYELSVFFPPRKWSNIEKISNETIPHYPIPWKIPPPKYDKNEVPWFIHKELV